jgi:hypothetical protein
LSELTGPEPSLKLSARLHCIMTATQQIALSGVQLPACIMQFLQCCTRLNKGCYAVLWCLAYEAYTAALEQNCSFMRASYVEVLVLWDRDSTAEGFHELIYLFQKLQDMQIG